MLIAVSFQFWYMCWRKRKNIYMPWGTRSCMSKILICLEEFLKPFFQFPLYLKWMHFLVMNITKFNTSIIQEVNVNIYHKGEANTPCWCMKSIKTNRSLYPVILSNFCIFPTIFINFYVLAWAFNRYICRAISLN